MFEVLYSKFKADKTILYIILPPFLVTVLSNCLIADKE